MLFVSNKISNAYDQNPFFSYGLRRYRADFLQKRFTSYYSDILNINKIPSLKEAPGLGKTVGSTKEARSKDFYLDDIEACKGTGREWEYKRLICVFGFYGHILILFCRLIPSIYLLIIKFKYYDKNLYKSSSLGIFIVSLMILLQAQFNINDVFAGILCISLTSNMIYKIGIIEEDI